MKLDPGKTGLALGALFALWHAAWSLLVVLGFAQALLNFVFSIHFLSNPFVVNTFSLMTALVLMAVTFAVGNVMGYIFALVWNKVHRG